MASHRIGIDVRKYRDFGIGTYIQNLLDQFCGLQGGDLTIFAAPGDAAELSSRYGVRTVVNASPKYSLQELVSLSLQSSRSRLDVLHCPHYTLPFGLRCRSVVTIHDLIHLRFPEYFSLPQRLYAKAMIGHACAAADRIITVSRFTQDDLEREFPQAVGKVETIHHGVSEKFAARLGREENEKFLERHGLVKPYILYVGSAKPHKNIGVLLEGYRRSGMPGSVQLVSAGEPLTANDEGARLLEDPSLRANVIELGRLNDDDLAAAYQNALVVVLPSRYEGFGFSLIEAMKAGAAVIGARAASIPEVMGEAGLLFDPDSPDELASLIHRVATERDLRTALAALGAERVKQFTWEACARKTMDTYRKALE